MLSGPQAAQPGSAAASTSRCTTRAQTSTAPASRPARGAAADRDGPLVVLAANPPDSPIGRWVEEHHEQTKAGKIERVLRAELPRQPWITAGSLEALKNEVDEVTYARGSRAG